MSERAKIAATALLVCVIYFLGAKVGEQLRLLPVTTSVLWPPNAVLTATLLLAPTRRWWVYLLAALPAHLVVQLGAGRALPFVLALFLTNCSEALLAAAGVRRFGAGHRFDTLRDVAIFMVYAVFAAPFLSSFADAAVVALFASEPYWLVWRTRFFANTLTELMLVPAIVMLVTGGWPWIRDASPRRRLEALLMAVTPIVVGIVVFEYGFDEVTALRESPATQLAFVLPGLLWAAVRFGPGGLSLALLMTTLVAIWAGGQWRGPFVDMSPTQSVLAFQIFATVTGIPLLCLAAAVKEQRRTQHALAERLQLERLLSELSTSFVHVAPADVDAAFEQRLRQLGEYVGVDRLAIYRFSEGDDLLAMYSWTRPGATPLPPLTTVVGFPWIVRELRAERPVAVARPEDLPWAAAHDAETLRERGVRSALVLPIVAAGQVFGGLAFATFAVERAWPAEQIKRLTLVAEVFGSALAQKEAMEAVQASETMKSAILASLSSGVAVLDHGGAIITVNESWSRMARVGIAWGAEGTVGDNYVETCRRAGRDGEPHAAEAADLIEAVLNRSLPTFSLEYGVGEPANRWFLISVVPLQAPNTGAVIAHAEITERKRAEIEAQRTRHELAHSARVSTMGELTASLAHELNQPLAGIMANAQAAQRFIDAVPPDYSEVREILADIVDDDKRAAEVINRMRELLTKGESRIDRVDVNGVVRDVLKLVASDTIIRHVKVGADLAPGPRVVLGDRVQLQQLLLNLVLNAMEAVSDAAASERTVLVSTKKSSGSVEVFVEDSGPGLRPGTEGLIFDPFYTTKRSGMGMGLSIARSIVHAHGGEIWARNDPPRGATIHFAVPLAAVTPP
jgi:signal transduction histidine kinase/integral membrane sensor domain MASE1